MRRKIGRLATIAIVGVMLLNAIAYAAYEGYAVCPRCGNHTGTYTRSTGDYHNTVCSGCGSTYNQKHYIVTPEEEGEHSYCYKCGLRFN